MNGTSNNPLILSHLVRGQLENLSDLDVLTFVQVMEDGSFVDETRTYGELWTNGQAVARSLDSEAMQRGSAFAIMMQNHPEFVDTMMGSAIAGTVFVPVDPRTRGQKLAFMLNHAGCRGVVIGDYALSSLEEVLLDCKSIEWIWVVGSDRTDHAGAGKIRVRNFRDILASQGPNLDIRVVDQEEPMQMLYTSGTTGDPKAILSAYSRFGFVGSLAQTFGLRKEDRPYTGLSLTHANAQLITLGSTLAMGVRGVFSRKFTKSRLWDITRHYGCTTFNLLGGMTTAIYSEPLRDNDSQNPVRFVLSAGMPAAIWDKFSKRFNVDIFEFYGAAEGGLTMNPPGGGGPVGSIGKAPPGFVGKIVDENDNEVPPGEPGEIVFQNKDGSSPIVSYFNNQKASSDKTRDGWLRMGDIGYKDEKGWFYFLYRKGGGIRHNGDFVNPAFVEKELAEHPSITDVFVYGVESKNGVPGEKDVVAAIVPTGRQHFDPGSIFLYCIEKLESNFVPSYLQVVQEIPKTASEKPQERFLLEAFSPDADNVYTN